MTTFDTVPERRIQHAVRRLLNDPSRIFTSTAGERLQILAPGRINVHEGPDFLDMIVLQSAEVRVGSAEFHRRSSEWLAHHHEQDVLYIGVVLHIVLEDDLPGCTQGPTLVLSAEQLQPYMSGVDETSPEQSMEDIHTYSLLRLLRMTAEHRSLLEHRTTTQAWLRSSEQFLLKYLHKRRRPGMTLLHLQELLLRLESSAQARFLQTVDAGHYVPIADALERLVHSPIASEGTQLRSELIMNCLIPCVLAVAEDAQRVNIFEWYWSAEAFGTYAVLQRLFSGLSQQYVWQQQGMLEILREKHVEVSTHEQRTEYGLYHQVASMIELSRQKIGPVS